MVSLTLNGAANGGPSFGELIEKDKLEMGGTGSYAAAERLTLVMTRSNPESFDGLPLLENEQEKMVLSIKKVLLVSSKQAFALAHSKPSTGAMRFIILQLQVSLFCAYLWLGVLSGVFEQESKRVSRTGIMLNCRKWEMCQMWEVHWKRAGKLEHHQSFGVHERVMVYLMNFWSLTAKSSKLRFIPFPIILDTLYEGVKPAIQRKCPREYCVSLPYWHIG